MPIRSAVLVLLGKYKNNSIHIKTWEEWSIAGKVVIQLL